MTGTMGAGASCTTGLGGDPRSSDTLAATMEGRVASGEEATACALGEFGRGEPSSCRDGLQGEPCEPPCFCEERAAEEQRRGGGTNDRPSLAEQRGLLEAVRIEPARTCMDEERTSKPLGEGAEPLRWSCRSCSLDGNFTSMSFRPCDLKMTKLLSTLQTFTSIYNFDIRLPLLQNDIQKENDMKKILLKAISLLSQRLKSAKALLDGSLITEYKGSVTEGPHEIEILLPFSDVISMQAGSGEEVVGLVNFSGTIFAQAHSFPREPLLQTVEDLKRDIIASLKSRLEILCDEAEQSSISRFPEENSASEESSFLKPGHPLFSCNWSEPCSFAFPRRVLVPWLDGIFICDYLQPTETFQDLDERCKELLSIDIPPDQSAILEPEAPGATSIGTSFWGMAVGNSASSSLKPGQENSREPGKDAISNLPKLRTTSRTLYGAIAVSVSLIAMLIALIMMFVDQRMEKQQ